MINILFIIYKKIVCRWGGINRTTPFSSFGRLTHRVYSNSFKNKTLHKRPVSCFATVAVAPAREDVEAPAGQTPELKEGKDKLQRRYAATGIHEAWTADETIIQQWSILSIMTMATRQVLGHIVMPRGSITGKNCADLLGNTIAWFGVPKIFHTDSAPIFHSEEMVNLLREQNVIRSQGHQSEIPHHNQVQERFHATLKQRLRKRLKELLGLKRTPKTFAKVSLLDEQTLKDTIYEAIQDYNNTPHSFLYGMSPQNMETAIAMKGKQVGKVLFNSTEGQLATESSPKGGEIAVYRSEVARLHALDWQQFFIEWHFNTYVHHKQVMEELKNITKSQREIIMMLAHEKLRLQGELKDLRGELSARVIESDELAKRLEVVESDVAYLNARENSREQQERETAEARARRAARAQAPCKVEAYAKDYAVALQHVASPHRFVIARRRVALLILYLTGMGVARALQLTVMDLKLLRDFAQTGEGELRMPAPTRGRVSEYMLPLPPVAKDLVVARLDDLQELIGDFPDEEPAFRESVRGRICRQDIFTRELNCILKEVGQELKKPLTTHSFRIGLIHSAANVAGTDIAKYIAGHTHTKPSEPFSRLRTKGIRSTLQKVFTVRSHTIQNVLTTCIKLKAEDLQT